MSLDIDYLVAINKERVEKAIKDKDWKYFQEHFTSMKDTTVDCLISGKYKYRINDYTITITYPERGDV